MDLSIEAAPFLNLCHNFSAVFPSIPLPNEKVVVLGPMTEAEWSKKFSQLQLACRWKKNNHNSKSLMAHQNTLAKGLQWRDRYVCSHAGKKDTRSVKDVPQEKKRKRTSIKVGCRAYLSVSKALKKDEVTVKWSWKHENHDPLDMSAASASRLLPSVKAWIKDRVAEGRDWRSIHDLLRIDPDTLDSLTINSNQVPAGLRVKRMDVYNVLRAELVSDSRKHKQLLSSLQTWAGNVRQDGGWAYIEEKFVDLKTNRFTGWAMGFATKWQLGVLEQHASQIACLDSTHNTCTGVDAKEAVFLYTVVVRNTLTGRGSPVAFMITNVESSLPIKSFLKKLHCDQNFAPQYMMIDCSDTEVSAIKDSLPKAKVVYCLWHFLKSASEQSKKRISAPTNIPAKEKPAIVKGLRSQAMDGIKHMVRAESEQEHAKLWGVYQEEWSQHQDWLKYVREQWLPVKERWSQAWRNTPHNNIDTNNYIERWHEELKRRYLKSLRRQRADYLVFLLVTKVLPDYRQQEKAVELGFCSKRYNLRELTARKQADQLPLEVQELKVRVNRRGRVEVESFKTAGHWYRLTLEGNEERVVCTSCTCPASQIYGGPCKHMWLALLVRGILPGEAARRQIPTEAPQPYRVATAAEMVQLIDEAGKEKHAEQLAGCKAAIASLFAEVAQLESDSDGKRQQRLVDTEAALRGMVRSMQQERLQRQPYAPQR